MFLKLYGQVNLRLLDSKAPGMYPAHTDSSLLTLAPKSSSPGLEERHANCDTVEAR